MFTLADIHAQTAALGRLPAVGEPAFLPAAVALLEAMVQHPPEGIRQGWPASRRWSALGYDRADDCVFYPANLAYLLQHLPEGLEPTLGGKVKAIGQGITAQYGLYRSVPGLWSYAFYQTRPEKRWFPFGSRFSRLEHFRPPDDPDDTALIYLTLPHAEDQRSWLRNEKLPSHAGQVAGPVPHTLPQWQGLSAYTTFFAQKMPLSYDVGVLANVMNWVLRQPEPLSKHDLDSLQILSETIQQGLFIEKAYQIAPYYAHPVGLGYTLARFLAAHPQHPFSKMHAPLLAEKLLSLQSSPRFTGFEHLVLQNACLMLGQEVGAIARFTPAEAGDFSLFRFPLGAEYPLWLAQAVAPLPWLSVRFSSPAFALGLLLEHHLLKFNTKR